MAPWTHKPNEPSPRPSPIRWERENLRQSCEESDGCIGGEASALIGKRRKARKCVDGHVIHRARHRNCPHLVPEPGPQPECLDCALPDMEFLPARCGSRN